MNRRAIVAIVLWLAAAPCAHALDWISIAPNPTYSRDLSMGAEYRRGLLGATVAEHQSGGAVAVQGACRAPRGPAPESRRPVATGRVPPLRSTVAERGEELADGLRLLAGGAAFQTRILTVAALLTQPVMRQGDTLRYRDYGHETALREHQNSLVFSLALHPRVSVGGRIDRYYQWDAPEGEGYSYGVILRPRGVNVGVQYQHYPDSLARVWHPLDRRSNEGTNAAVAVVRDNFTVSFQVMNLTQSANPAFLEPHAGIEWRPVRSVALRAGAVEFSRSHRWAWTAGFGLLDANWLHRRENRLRLPDDVLQVAVGVVYDRNTPVQGISSLTCAWRF